MLELEPGDTFGELTVERKLGQGAFGAVYLARDALIGRSVALKVILAQSGRHEQILREARLVGQLAHDNVVTLFRVHPPDGSNVWGFEFEFVDGGTLQQVVAEGGAAPNRALELALGITSGLAAAHRAGVVHGDVKPGNVLISTEPGHAPHG